MLDINQQEKKNEMMLTCICRNLFVNQNKNRNEKVTQFLRMIIADLCQLTKNTTEIRRRYVIKLWLGL